MAIGAFAHLNVRALIDWHRHLIDSEWAAGAEAVDDIIPSDISDFVGRYAAEYWTTDKSVFTALKALNIVIIVSVLVVVARFEKRTLAEHEQNMYVAASIPHVRGALHRAYPCEIRGAFHGTDRA